MNLLFLAALLTQMLVNPLPAQATTFVPRPLPETTQRTATIVRGQVTSAGRGDWGKNAEGTTRIYTYYEFQVSETFKGGPKPGTTIQFRELGGEKDGVGMQVAGSAQFKTGEDVVLMLGEKNDDGSYNLRGLMTGKFGIGRDPLGRETLIGATGDDDAHPGQDTHGPWTIDEFRKMVASQSSTARTETASPRASHSPPISSPTASVGAPKNPTSAAPQLQSQPDQGAPQSKPLGIGFSWGFAIAAVLLVLSLLLAWTSRR